MINAADARTQSANIANALRLKKEEYIAFVISKCNISIHTAIKRAIENGYFETQYQIKTTGYLTQMAVSLKAMDLDSIGNEIMTNLHNKGYKTEVLDVNANSMVINIGWGK